MVIRLPRRLRLAYAVAVAVCVVVVLSIVSLKTPQRLTQQLRAALRSAAVDRTNGLDDNRIGFGVYPKRVNMSECPPLYGKVTVLVIMVQRSYDTHYRAAQETLRCYLKSTNYSFVLVDLDSDKRVNQACKHDQLFFKKHCAAATYLSDSDWILVLDADTGVVNPNHCIEEWIDPRVDLIFYERFFNWEIASGNYIAKNTTFVKDFLMGWANLQYHQPLNFSGADNGALQIHILQTVMPEAKQEIANCDKIWRESDNYKMYMAYVTCVKIYLGATRIWPGKLRILRRAHGWVRDGFITSDKFCDNDFMLHGWKVQNIGDGGWESPFFMLPNQTECGTGYDGWYWRDGAHITVDMVRERLSSFERHSGTTFPTVARVIPYLDRVDVGECYPNCDDPLRINS